jgi:putative endonuclease
MEWKLYMVRCRNGSLYIGIAKDVLKRVATHNLGKGSKSIRAHGLPVELVYQEVVGSYSEALKREHQLKQCSKQEKEKWVGL